MKLYIDRNQLADLNEKGYVRLMEWGKNKIFQYDNLVGRSLPLYNLGEMIEYIFHNKKIDFNNLRPTTMKVSKTKSNTITIQTSILAQIDSTCLVIGWNKPELCDQLWQEVVEIANNG